RARRRRVDRAAIRSTTRARDAVGRAISHARRLPARWRLRRLLRAHLADDALRGRRGRAPGVRGGSIVRRLLGFLPLALLGGCGFRPWTPSVSVAFWSEDVPANRDVILPRGEDAARAWLLSPELAWSKYGKGTLFVSTDEMGGSALLPDVRSLEVVAKAQ